VKTAKLVEEFASDDEDVFVSHLHRHYHSEPTEESLIICSQTGKTMSRDVSTSFDMTGKVKTST
jgi:hypothetical protein